MNQSTIGNREQSPNAIAKGSAVVRATLLLATGLAMAGCSILGGKGEAPTIYAPDPRIELDPSLPRVSFQLSLTPVTAPSIIDSPRIAVMPKPGEMQVYKGARWAKTPPEMLQDAVLRALEDSDRIPAVSRQGDGVSAEYKLVMDLRRFEAVYAGGATPAATIEVRAKLLHGVDQDIVDAKTFVEAYTAAGTDPARVSEAFSQALGDLTTELTMWVLISGELHDTLGHREGEAKGKGTAR